MIVVVFFLESQLCSINNSFSTVAIVTLYCLSRSTNLTDDQEEDPISWSAIGWSDWSRNIVLSVSRRPRFSSLSKWTWFSSWKIFDAATLKLITYYQETIQILTPQPGWVEQDPHEILDKTVLCIEKAVQQLQDLGYDKSNIKGRKDGNERNEHVFVFP